MKLARIPLTVEEAAKRLAALDRGRTNPYGHNMLHTAFSGGLGPRYRNQVVEDLAAVLGAVLGRQPTMSELFGDSDGGGDEAA